MIMNSVTFDIFGDPPQLAALITLLFLPLSKVLEMSFSVYIYIYIYIAFRSIPCI